MQSVQFLSSAMKASVQPRFSANGGYTDAQKLQYKLHKVLHQNTSQVDPGDLLDLLDGEQANSPLYDSLGYQRGYRKNEAFAQVEAKLLEYIKSERAPLAKVQEIHRRMLGDSYPELRNYRPSDEIAQAIWARLNEDEI